MTIKKSSNQEESREPYDVKASITDLVRLNLRGLLNIRQSNTVVNNAFIQAFDNWEKNRKSGNLWKLFHLILGANQSIRSREEWSLARLAAELKVDVSVMRKIFDAKNRKGTEQISIDDVVELASYLM